MKSRDIAIGGILVALTIIVLYATSILPISTLAILTIASAIIPICIIRSNVQTSIFVYISSSLIAFFLVPINISLLYFIFFGVYGIVKYFIERIRKENLEIILKLVFFNIVFVIGFIIMQNILGVNIIAGLEELISKLFNNSARIYSLIMERIHKNI